MTEIIENIETIEIMQQLHAGLEEYLRTHYRPDVYTSEESGILAEIAAGPEQAATEPSAAGSTAAAIPGVRQEIVTPQQKDAAPVSETFESAGAQPQTLDALLAAAGPTFREQLFTLIRESGLTDAEVYRRADLDRKLFSKIRSNPAYHPRKDVVLALALALRLDLPATEDLLARAEYALSPGRRSDLIIRYCIEHGVTDLQTVNQILHDHGEPILGEA